MRPDKDAVARWVARLSNDVESFGYLDPELAVRSIAAMDNAEQDPSEEALAALRQLTLYWARHAYQRHRKRYVSPAEARFLAYPVCKRCGGEGTVPKNLSGSVIDYPCPDCEGFGRSIPVEQRPHHF